MSRDSRRATLMARYRQGSKVRVATMLDQLADEDPVGNETLASLRASLHTLKGESRMLGLASLASFAHTIEDHLAEERPKGERIAHLRAGLELIDEWLDAPLVEDREAEIRLARGHALLAGATPGEASKAGRRKQDRPATKEDERAESAPEGEPPAKPASEEVEEAGSRRRLVSPGELSLVRTQVIDELCERLEVLRASLGRQARSEGPVDLEQSRHELAELAELAWGLRLVSVEPALRELARHARELGAELDKDILVRIDAGGAELERSLLERLDEPLLHLVRNAIDHGIESRGQRGEKPSRASLSIVARSLGAEVEIEVRDDGRGVNLEQVRRRASEHGLLDENSARTAGPEELLRLLFESGLSTSASVGELSGRGVGLDVVRRAVEGLGGEVTVSSSEGRGALFRLRVPATISRETVVVVESGGLLWGLPSRRVGPIVALDEGEATRGASPAVVVDDEHVPLLSLSRLLSGSQPHHGTERIAICCSHAGRRYALASSPVVGEHELFRRPLGPTLASVGPASSSAVMDDGRLVLLLEPAALLGLRHRLRGQATPRRPAQVRPDVLIVDDSPIVRELLVELLSGAGIDVRAAVDGADALEMINQKRPQLVLSDVEMPKLGGFELLARIRERDRELPVIMLTTRGSVADRQRATSLGADAYVVKSDFREQTLLDIISRFVEVPR